MIAILLQTPPATSRGFDTGVVWQTIRGMGEAFLARLPYIVIGIIVFGVFIIAARILRKVVHTAGERTRLDITLADLLARIASFAIIVLGIFVAAVIMFPAFKPGDLVAGLGITSLAIGFAFKDVLQNFFAGILILWRRPFVVGDQIKTRDYEGTVEEINVRNGDVYANAILVRTAYDHRRIRFTVGIGYPDSIEEARETIHGVLRGIEGVMDDPSPCVYVSELAPYSVNFAVLFWTKSQQANVLKVSDRVATEIKNALDAAQIDMPFPHNVVLFHDVTGSRPGDIERAKYIRARIDSAKQNDDDAAPGTTRAKVQEESST